MSDTEERPNSKKDRPTPTRKEQQAKKAQPLIGGTANRKPTSEEKSKMRELRRAAQDGMMRGEEKYLSPRDKGPQRRYAREYVDARRNLGDIAMFGLLIGVVGTFIPIYNVQLSFFALAYLYLLISIVDAIICSRKIEKKLLEKYGKDKLQAGIKFYASMRALYPRIMRTPRPQNKRGEWPK